MAGLVRHLTNLREFRHLETVTVLEKRFKHLIFSLIDESQCKRYNHGDAKDSYNCPQSYRDIFGSYSVTKSATWASISVKGLRSFAGLTRDVSSTPAAPLVLGFSGLLPFLYPPVSMISSGALSGDLVFAHMAYGATILSFIGGLRWGYCMSPASLTSPNWLYLGYSVSPQLIGWSSLLMPESLGILTLIGGLVGCAIIDVKMAGYPAWFLSLRVILTTGAIISLVLTLTCMLLLDEEQQEQIV